MKWDNVRHVKADITLENGDEITVIKNMANVEIVVPRSGNQHRFVMSVITKTLQMTIPFKAIRDGNKDDFLLAFKEWAEMYDLVQFPWGIGKQYHSLSYDKMDGVEFQEVAKKIIDFCFLLLGYGPSEHIDALDNFIREVEYKYNCRVKR